MGQLLKHEILVTDTSQWRASLKNDTKMPET